MKFVLDGELQSDRLIQAFGWCEDISSETLAYQLVAIAEEVNQNGQLNETDISIGDRNTQSLKAVIHQVQEIYERLDQSRAEQQHTEDESTTKEDTHDSSGDRDFASVQKILAGLPWIWTGKEFVTTSRIAFEADPALEPLLFVAPPELLIPKYLLLAFQVKDSFDSNDYLMALSLLPKDIQLEASQVKACLKVFEHLSQTLKEDQNQGQLSVMLLDTSNTLVPASSLVYDDMQWNESAEIRRGCRFIHKNISREVALTLGACSLHSRLADASSSSIRLRCPSKTTLGSLLPSIEETERNVWQKYFISELLNAIEWQMKAKFFDMVIDYRRHPCQRVIRPSFQTLQNDALCIHIPELVLSTEDIYALLNSSQNTNKAGILAGFYFADCLQILSGDGFYVIDPSGNFLNDQEQVISPTEEGLARRYDVLAQDFARYADQLLPFSALPCCEGNMNNGTRSTILRYCFRREVNLSFSIKNFAILDSKIDKFVSFIKKDVLPTALVFSETLQRISIWSVGKDSKFAIHLHGECHLQNAVSILKKRISTRQNVEWKKKFSLQSFFKTSVVPSTTMEFDIKMEIENKRWIDTWLFVDNIGAGRTRDLAGSAVHEILLNVIPYIAIACHLQRDGKLVETGYATSRSTRQGRLFQGAVDLFETTGLPIHINGGFELERKQWGRISQRQIVAGRRVPNSTEQTQAKSQDEVANDMRAHWNRVLVEDGVIEAYVQLLNLAKKRCEQINPKALYRFWPTLSTKKASDIGNMVQTLMYRHLGAKDLFLCTDGTFRSLNGGYFLNLEGMHLQVASFAQLHFPSFHLPSQVRHDCGRLLTSQNFRMHWLTPRVMRKFLRTINVNTIHSGICLPLFEYCLSDLQCPLPAENSGIWLEFQSLPILPLANGSTGLIRLNQKNKYYLGSFNHHQLLPTLASQFISLEARKRLGRFFADRTFCNVLSFTSFSIKTLSDHIESMLPASWKNQLYVEWNSSHDHQSNVKFSRIWLCRFWKEVRFDRRSLAYFSTWPLIPVKSMNHGDQDDVIQLVSCGKPGCTLYLGWCD
jgi:hypothetical protein